MWSRGCTLAGLLILVNAHGFFIAVLWLRRLRLKLLSWMSAKSACFQQQIGNLHPSPKRSQAFSCHARHARVWGVLRLWCACPAAPKPCRRVRRYGLGSVRSIAGLCSGSMATGLTSLCRLLGRKILCNNFARSLCQIPRARRLTSLWRPWWNGEIGSTSRRVAPVLPFLGNHSQGLRAWPSRLFLFHVP